MFSGSDPRATPAWRVLRLLGRLPAPLRERLGDGLVLPAWVLLRQRRNIAARNLELCFPEQSAAWRLALLRACFREYCRTLLDLCWLSRTPAHQLRRQVVLEGEEHLRRGDGRGVILLAPHFRGMNMGGVRISMEFAMRGLYQQQHNPLAEAFLLRLHERFQLRMVSRREPMLKLCRWLRRGGILYYLPDLDLNGRDRPVFVPFLGVRETATGTALGRIAELGRAHVVPCVTRALGKGRYRVRLYPAWRDFPGNDTRAAARRVNRFIEDQVRVMPEQYYWLHRRFKTRPPGTPARYFGS